MPQNKDYELSSAATFRIAGIVLAAGQGSRFDPSGQRYKLTEKLSNGQTVIVAACTALINHVDFLVVVEGSRGRELDPFLANMSALHRVHCAEAERGMGASLKAGILASGLAQAWLIGLGDMPYVASATIAQVCAELRAGAKIVRPFYDDQPGHPVGIAGLLRDELLGLPDQAGAAALIQRHQDKVVRIDVDDPGSVTDIDYPADLPGRL